MMKAIFTLIHFSPDLSNYEFSVGGHRSADTGEATRQTFRAQQIIRHEGYKGNGYSNDIALIKLDGLVQYNDYASPACLAESRPSNGVDAYVTGWGSLSRYNIYCILAQTIACIAYR